MNVLREYWWVLALVAIAVFLTFFTGTTPPDNSKLVDTIKQQIEADQQREMQKLTDKIKLLEKDVKLSNQKYNQLKSSISVSDKEMRDIKAPVSNSELRQRLADLGYQVR